MHKTWEVRFIDDPYKESTEEEKEKVYFWFNKLFPERILQDTLKKALSFYGGEC